MKIQRVILANGSRLISEMLNRALKKNHSLQIIAHVSGLKQAAQVMAKQTVNWVILTAPQHTEEYKLILEKMIKQNPKTRFLEINADGSQVSARWMAAQKEQWYNISLQQLNIILQSSNPADITEKIKSL